MLIGVTVTTALLFLLIEGRAIANQDILDDLDADRASWASLACESLYLGAVQLTGAGGFSPLSRLGKLLLLGYSIVVLFTIESYTANLAVAMITKKAAACNTFEQCAARGDRSCVRAGTAMDELLTAAYGEQLGGQIVRTTSEWGSQRAGECELAVIAKLILDLQRVSEEHNSDCSIERVGVEPVSVIDGGWMGKLDYMDHCTSVVFDALRPHFIALRSSGKIAELTRELLAAANTRIGAPCVEASTRSLATFGVEQLTGPLVVYAAVVVLVLTWWCTSRATKRMRTVPTEASAAPDKDVTAVVPSDDAKILALSVAELKTLLQQNLPASEAP